MTMIHDITSATPRNKRPMRKGRGRSAGKGKTAGKGNKGMKARAGAGVRTGYEGGQTEIFRRFPKKGFSNFNFETKYHVVNLHDLNKFDDGATVDTAALIAEGLVPNEHLPVKVLGQGTLKRKLTVSVDAYSQSALKSIADAGGTTQDAGGNAVSAAESDDDPAHASSGESTGDEGDDVPQGGTAPDGKTPPTGVQPEAGTRSVDAPGAANVTEQESSPDEDPTSGNADNTADQPESGTR